MNFELSFMESLPAAARPIRVDDGSSVGWGNSGSSISPSSNELEFQQLIDGLPEQIALVDGYWNVVTVNRAWTRTAASYGYSALQPGTNYLDFLRERAIEGHNPAKLVVDGIEKMEFAGTDRFRFLYHGSDRWEGHAFQLRIHRFEMSGRKFATITRYDVTELVRLRDKHEARGNEFFEGREAERRQIAQDLHDSTLQQLACLGLAIGQLKRTRKKSQKLEIMTDIEQMLSETQREIRSLSYLAHPPLLEEMGLARALGLLATGFGRRSNMRVELHIQGNVESKWETANIALYRVVQEALSNIHRHANATEITVGLAMRRSFVHVVVTDNGWGIPTSVVPGVGLASMQERLDRLGGRLAIRLGKPGTIIIASLPIRPGIAARGDLVIDRDPVSVPNLARRGGHLSAVS